MVQTITPAVHGGRRLSYVGSVALHALGATVSAAALGAVLGTAGAALGAPWGSVGLLVVAAVAALYALREAAGLPLPLPQLRRQVPEWWRSFFSPPIAALLYGLGLGVGFLTYLTFGTFVAVCAAAVASGDPLVGASALGLFGLARALSILVGGHRRELEAVARLEQLADGGLPRAANAVALAGICGLALTSL